MPKTLSEFLIQLSTDPLTVERFQSDARGVMEAAGLPLEDQQALLSRNPAKVRQRLNQAFVSHMTDTVKKKTTKKKKKATKKK